MGPLERNPTRTEEAAGNILHDHLGRSKGLDPENQFCEIWESAGFKRRVSARLRCRTYQDVKDGVGDRTGTFSEIHYLWIIWTPKSNCGSRAMQRSAQFLQSRPSVILKSMESKFYSPARLETNVNSWVVISRGPNRYVDELRYHDPEHYPESFEEADYGSIEETHAEQRTTCTKSQCTQFEDHILNHTESGLTQSNQNQGSSWKQLA